MTKPFNFCFRQEGNNTHKLYIYDDVTAYGKFNWSTWSYDDSETSAKFFRDQLAAIPDTDTIELHINSNGGSVKEGVAIYNQLKQKACKKTGYVDGVAYSVAFVILQACDHRVMGMGTSALVHEIWIEACGNSKELRKIADDLDVLMESNRKIFLERSKLEENQLAEMMEAETFLTPDQCLEYGLIDEIDSYSISQEDAQSAQENLRQQVQQMENLVAQIKDFHTQMQELRQSAKPDPVPAPKKLMNQLANVMKNM
ncbi:MAG: Clp protease ClpP [Lachnospiraceae bacterium]|nr:Clp protease ClpP [Lachnospiraceae bacterium]